MTFSGARRAVILDSVEEAVLHLECRADNCAPGRCTVARRSMTDFDLHPPRPWFVLPDPDVGRLMDPEMQGEHGLAVYLGPRPRPTILALLSPSPSDDLFWAVELTAPALQLHEREQTRSVWWEAHVQSIAASLPYPAAVVDEDGMLVGSSSPLSTGASDIGVRGSVQLNRGPRDGNLLWLCGEVAGLPARGVVWSDEFAPSLPAESDLQELFGLSPKEVEACRLLAQGASTKALAKHQEVSWHTARGRVEQCRKKLGVSRRSEILPRLLEVARLGHDVWQDLAAEDLSEPDAAPD